MMYLCSVSYSFADIVYRNVLRKTTSLVVLVGKDLGEDGPTAAVDDEAIVEVPSRWHWCVLIQGRDVMEDVLYRCLGWSSC